MFSIALISAFGVSVIAIVYSLLLFFGISSKPAGSKKMFDVSKILTEELKKKQLKNIRDFSLAGIVLFTGIMYSFGWQAAASFLVSAVLFVLVDYYLMNLSSKTAVRLAEAAKSSAVAAYKLNYNFSVANTYLMAGSGLLLLTIVYFLFNDPICLVALALSAILISFFSWRSSRQNYFGAFIGILVVASSLIKLNVSNYSNAEYLPLMFTSFILLISVISRLVSGISSATLSVSAAFNRGLVFVSVLIIAAAYFAPKYILDINNTHLLIKLAAALIFGLLLNIAILSVKQFSKVLPTVAIALVILVANYLSGTFGLILAALGFLALWPLAMIASLFTYQTKNAEIIAATAEMPENTTRNIKSLDSSKIRTSGYFISLFGILAIGTLIYYFLKLKGTEFLITDTRILSGLLFGAVLSYLLSSELFIDKILKISVVVLVSVLAGLTLGPVFLAGVLVGAILVDLLVSQAVNGEVLVLAIVGVLTSSFIENQYSTMIRGIIAASVMVLAVGYFVTKKVIDGRKTKNLATGV